MKRFFLGASAAFLGVAIILTAGSPASALAAAGKSGQQGPSPAQVREEYDAYVAAYNAFSKDHDFQKSWDMAKAFMEKYPNSQYAPQARQLALQSRGNVYSAAYQSEDYAKVFSIGKEFLAEDPGSLSVLLQLAIAGGRAAKKGDFKYQDEGMEYGHKAIEMIEGGQRPNGTTEADWNGKTKNGLLGQLYQISGLFHEKSEKLDDAIGDLKKSAELDSSDPVTYYLLGRLHFRAYSDLAGQYAKLRDEYNAMTDDQKISDAGKEVLAKVEAQRDKVNAEADLMIDSYAHVLGATEGKSGFDAIRNEITPRLEAVYKYRNNGTVDGLGDKIRSFKGTPAAGSPQPVY